MLDVIKGYFSKNYENSFFRDFAGLLSKLNITIYFYFFF